MEYAFGVLLLAALYLIPSIIASQRRHRNGCAVAVLNITLGWTVIGWLVALIWACTDNTGEPKR